ncbi:nuclear transport factor 2 family protein [Streptosporangium vulgare]|uniref:Nuclear transport factor 2 family protein n=2 Tax=Streptosporangium vulgare TaxID=46190 RepID=A0ABV5TK68_9ACTN
MSPQQRRSRSTGLIAVAVDHARLSYDYLNAGDVDAYASLFEKDVVVRRPDLTVRGRAALERCQDGRAAHCHYTVTTVIASEEHVVVIGVLTGETAEEVEFADVFTFSEQGLFTTQQSFFFGTPG